ncbi:MAG: glycosyltransferase [bacterium]
MVVLEAMACGCPLLVANSPTSAAKDFVHNNGYTFDCKNPQDLADKIETLCNDQELCERMRKVSYEESQKFSFTLSVQKLESFL